MASRTAHKLKLRATATGGSCCWGIVKANYAHSHAHAHTHSTGQQVALLLSLSLPPVRLHLTATLIFPMLSGCATRLSQLQFLLLFVPQPVSPKFCMCLSMCVCHMGVPHACVVCAVCAINANLSLQQTKHAFHIPTNTFELAQLKCQRQRTAAQHKEAPQCCCCMPQTSCNRALSVSTLSFSPFLSLSLLLCPEGIYNQSEGRQRFYFMRVIYVNCKYFNKLPFAAPPAAPATCNLPTAMCHVARGACDIVQRFIDIKNRIKN